METYANADLSAKNVLGGGEMGALIHSFDWSRTPVGPMSAWPSSLKTAVRIALGSRYPMFVWWGRQFTNFYNDAYIPVLGQRHPEALGRPAAQVWSDIWGVVGPQAAEVMDTGRATWNEQLLLVMERNGYVEETYFTFSYSPITDETGAVEGVFCACTEDTAQVLGERRLRALRALATQTVTAETAVEACQLAAQALADNPHDLPFTLLYLLPPGSNVARLVGATGLDPGAPAAPIEVVVQGADEPSSPWPLREVLTTGQAIRVVPLPPSLGPLTGGAWPEPTQTALILPIGQASQPQPAGFLVAGLSPRRALDDDYTNFLQLVAGYISAAIADARSLEAARQQAQALAELDRAKTAFFSNVSHEFRTPLTLLLGPLEDALAEPGDGLPLAHRQQLAVAHRNGLRLLKMVNALLDFSRIEAGRVQATYEPTDLATLTTELASVFRSAIERAGLRLVVDCPPLPELIYVDREMWEKIVLNLLSNALKFTHTGEIALRLVWTGTVVELHVSDTGIGIAPEEQPNVFARFHRIRGAQARTHEGTGIGLALVQELARLHGGSVRLESSPGQGSCFIVSLPAGSAHLPAERLGTSQASPPAPLGAAAYVQEAFGWLPEIREQDGRRPDEITTADLTPSSAAFHPHAQRSSVILVVDDNADMRDYLRRLLGQSWHVEVAGNGAIALAHIRQRPPDLVLSDVMMPGLDGFALLRALRANPRTRTLPVVLLSARAGEEARVEGLAAGADDYLVKPFSARELVARVAAQLDLARLRRELLDQAQSQAEQLRLIADNLPVLIAYVDADQRYQFNNKAYQAWFGQAPEALRGQSLRDVLGADAYAALRPHVAAALRGQPVTFEIDLPNQHGGLRPVRATYVPHTDAHGQTLGFYALVADITERRRSDGLQAEQRRVLEQVAQGAPLPDVLTSLCQLVEAQSSSGVLASVLLVDDDSAHLRHGAAPSLPPGYNQAIDGLAIGPAAGSCGTAAFRGEPVVAADIAADPLWVDFRDLALAHGLRACWSTPICDTHGAVLATFALYYPVPRQPSELDQQLVSLVTRLAVIAIERDRALRAVHDSEAQLQTLFDAVPLGVYLVDADFRLRAVNPTARPVFGDIPNLIGRAFDEVLHILWPSAYADEVVRLFRHTLATGEPYVTPERIEQRIDRGVTEYYEWQINRIPLPDGRFGVVCYFRDISAQVFARQVIADSEARLAVELADTQRLQRISTQLLQEDSIEVLYQQIVEAAMAVMRSDMGSLQMLYPERNELQLLAWQGFDPGSAAFWEWVRADSGSTCGVALHTGQRVIAPDVEAAPYMAGTDDLAYYRLSGIKTVQSTPLVSRSGHIVGMISTHWRQPHQPTERDLRLLDVLARQAADLIERKQAEAERAQYAAQLEERVAKRTTDLRTTNAMLEQEIASRHRASQELERSQEELRRLSAYLQQVREDERTRMAREIHDELGQQLTGLKMDVVALTRKLPTSPGQAPEALDNLTQAIDATIHTVRRLASELRPSILDDFGLVAAIEVHLGEFQRRAGLTCRLSAAIDDARVNADLRTALFRIFQEALTNIARHAEATQVEVLLEDRDNCLVLQVQDNGRGISEQELSGLKSLGLLGMRERVRLLSGELSITGAPAQGTTVLVTLPL